MVGSGTNPRYGAFVSYNHADRATARRLHRRLERYRIPAKLVGRETQFGPVPRRLGRIFRDLDELPAANDLSAEVRAALAQSDCLIVLCTPAAAASQWVAREIALFRELHPDRPILAALFEGEPATAMPPPLLIGADGAAAEPLAADFRPGRDGKRLALLKLVAGAVGVPLDALVQRDAQARVRRVTAVTLLAGLLLLAMAGLTILALQARAEAEVRRAQAEGLVEFMLTDLRDRLKEVGRLDVLRSANERALHYYGEQDLRQLPPDMLARRARALMTMGEDALEAKEMARARAAFDEAHRVTTALVARQPRDYELVFTHAQSEFWLGRLGYDSWKLADATVHFEAYERLARRLVALDPSDPRGSEEVGYATGSLCSLLLRKKDAQRAVALCGEALRVSKMLAARAPDDAQRVRDMANREGWLADATLMTGDLKGSVALRRAQVNRMQGLLDRDPRNARNERALIWAERALAKGEWRAGNPAAGAARMRQAIAQLRRMSVTDPENRELAANLQEMNGELSNIERTKQ